MNTTHTTSHDSDAFCAPDPATGEYRIFTCAEFEEAGGDLDELRWDADADDDHGLTDLIDAALATR